jgi:OTU domain-containing protein 6
VCSLRSQAAKALKGSAQADAIAEAGRATLEAADALAHAQGQELNTLEDDDPGAFAVMEAAAGDGGPETVDPKTAASSSTSSGGGGDKKSKAAKKREKERAKERERDARIAAEKAGAGPSARDVELQAINGQLAAGRAGGHAGVAAALPSSAASAASGQPAAVPLSVHEVLSDGHCLYRAVDHQLGLRGLPTSSASSSGLDGGGGGFQALRARAADAMRARPADFLPFLDLEGVGGLDFEGYCDRVASSAEWGGQPELVALSRALGLPIRVTAADPAEGTIVGWEEFGGGGEEQVAPLDLAYHKHYYALGEHYNSTKPLR